MKPPEFLSVKNWDRFQHYKDRKPPWIKLYVELADDYEFFVLPDQTKYHIIGIWMLAARTENKIPRNDKWVADKIGARTRVKLDTLVELGHLIPWVETEEPEEAKWASRYIPGDVRQAIFERDNNKCTECESTKYLEIDHILPISKGGDGNPDNLQLLCRRCNRAKRNRITAESKGLSAEQPATQMRSLETEAETERDKEKKNEQQPAPEQITPALQLIEPKAATNRLGTDRTPAYNALLARTTGGDPGTPNVIAGYCKQLPRERIEEVTASFSKPHVSAGIAVNALKNAVKGYHAELETTKPTQA